MGISGLLRFVKDATEPIHIKKYAGQTVAIDTYCWIHRGSFACAEKLAKNEHTDQYVKYCMKFIDMLESFHVKPILVFDGCRLPSKELVEQDRHKRRKENLEKGRRLLREGNLSAARDCFTKCISVTPAMALRVIEAARARGVDCIVAPYEADAQLAFFSKMKIAQAIITEDSDLLCFGCKNVVFKMDLTGRAQEVSMDNLGRVQNLVGFTPELFRHMCILSGCDYLPSVKGVGLVKACKALKLSKSKDGYQVASKLHQYIKSLAPVNAKYGAEFVRADKTFLYQLVFNPEKRKVQPLTDYPNDIDLKDLEFAGPSIADDKAFHIALGNIDINTKLVIGYFDIDNWVKSRKPLDNLPSIWGGSKLVDQKLHNRLSINKSSVVTKIKLDSNPEKVGVLSATDVLDAVTIGNGGVREKDPLKPTSSSPPLNSIKKIEVGDIKELLQTYQIQKVKKSSAVPAKTVRSRFFAPKSLSQVAKDFDTGSDDVGGDVSLDDVANHSSSLFSDKKPSDDSILNDILDEINDQVDSVVAEKLEAPPSSDSKSKRRKIVLSSGEALERFSKRKLKKRLTLPLINNPTPTNKENDTSQNNGAERINVGSNNESIPFFDKACVSQSLFGGSVNQTLLPQDSFSPDPDMSDGKNSFDEGVPIPNFGDYDSSSQRRPLIAVPDENSDLPSSRKYVISSDDEPDEGRNTATKCLSSDSKSKRRKIVLSSGEALDRFSKRKLKKRLTFPLINNPTATNKENNTSQNNGAERINVGSNDESIPFFDKGCVSQSLFGGSVNQTLLPQDSFSPDPDMSDGKNSFDEGVPILDQAPIPGVGDHDSSSQRRPLSVVADENHDLPSSPPKYVISSDDEPDEGRNTAKKCLSRRLGLPSHGRFKSPVKINTSKYFTGSKASGLRKRRRNSVPNQPSITSFFRSKS